jgi:hypothetical protein
VTLKWTGLLEAGFLVKLSSNLTSAQFVDTRIFQRSPYKSKEALACSGSILSNHTLANAHLLPESYMNGSRYDEIAGQRSIKAFRKAENCGQAGDDPTALQGERVWPYDDHSSVN